MQVWAIHHLWLPHSAATPDTPWRCKATARYLRAPGTCTSQVPSYASGCMACRLPGMQQPYVGPKPVKTSTMMYSVPKCSSPGASTENVVIVCR